MILMELSQIIITETSDEQIIVLKEVNGNRRFPIIIGSYEAMIINRKVKNIKTPRPLTHDLIENILVGLNAVLERIEVTQLKNNTFYARLVITYNGQKVNIDSRPSDAIVLATQMKVPIYVAEEVIDKVSGLTA